MPTTIAVFEKEIKHIGKLSKHLLRTQVKASGDALFIPNVARRTNQNHGSGYLLSWGHTIQSITNDLSGGILYRIEDIYSILLS